MSRVPVKAVVEYIRTFHFCAHALVSEHNTLSRKSRHTITSTCTTITINLDKMSLSWVEYYIILFHVYTYIIIILLYTYHRINHLNSRCPAVCWVCCFHELRSWHTHTAQWVHRLDLAKHCTNQFCRTSGHFCNPNRDLQALHSIAVLANDLGWDVCLHWLTSFNLARVSSHEIAKKS